MTIAIPPHLTKLDTVLSMPKPDITPQHFGLPLDHTSWRTHQLDTTLQWHAWWHVDSDTRITEAPTGSGKSVYPASMSRLARTVVVTHTKNLQAAYAHYGAAILYGRGNYHCIHPKADKTTMANDCLFAEIGMHKCPHSSDCPYLLAKHEAFGAPFAAVNYAYFLTARTLKETGIASLVLDEGHLLDNIVLGWSGCQINNNQRREWQLPAFPKLPKGIKKAGDLDQVQDWLIDSRQILIATWKSLQQQAEDNDSARKLARRCERLGGKVRATKNAIDAVKSAWFVRSGAGKIWYQGRPLPGIVIKPLTPKYHYRRLFNPPPGSGELLWKTYTMSATIGSFDVFAKNLGILEPVTTRVPNQYTPSRRPVYILDVPRMSNSSAKKDPTIWAKQADAIAQAILSVSSDWSGFVHVTRKKEASLLADRLAHRGLANRIWVPPQRNLQTGEYFGTQEQAVLWQERLSQVPNSIMVCWQFWAGYDGIEERISIVAKVPFPFYGSEYERERLGVDRAQYNLRAALQLMQACGRTRRGNAGDYDMPDQRNGLVAIADGSLSRVMKYLSQDFTEALTPWQN